MIAISGRPLWQAWTLLALTAAATAALLIVAWNLGGRMSARVAARSTDDLEWLQRKFDVDPARMESIRALHNAYLPRCAEYCQEIAAAKARLDELLTAGDMADPAIEETLAEIGRWRAKCQAAMLRHFQDVAAAMPREQGAAYLSEMRHLTISTHERIESRMSGGEPEPSEPHVHGPHH